MKRIHTITILTVVTLLTFLPFAKQTFAEGYAGYAGAFLRMGAGAVSMGTGDAGVARAMGVEQAHYNPAGLPFAPRNEFHLGYHVLSLDRRLIHVGGLYQVSGISQWKRPIRPLRATRAAGGANAYGILEPSRGARRRSQIDLSVNDYIESLADAILEYAGQEDWQNRLDPPLIEVDGFAYDATILESVFRSTIPVVRERNLHTGDEVLDILMREWREVREKPAAVAVTWTHAGTDDIEGRDFDGNHYDDFGFFENRFAMSFGLKLTPNLSAGVTAGILYALVPDVKNDGSSLTSTTFGADVGIQYRPFLPYNTEITETTMENIPYRLHTLTFGAAIYDISAKNSWNTDNFWSNASTRTDYYPDRYRFGASYEPLDGLGVYVDMETDLDELLRPKVGAEYAVIRPVDYASSQANRSNVYGLTVRAGMDRDRLTFGMGLSFALRGLGLTQIEYAYVPEPVSPEPTQVISWRFGF